MAVVETGVFDLNAYFGGEFGVFGTVDAVAVIGDGGGFHFRDVEFARVEGPVAEGEGGGCWGEVLGEAGVEADVGGFFTVHFDVFNDFDCQDWRGNKREL